MRFVLTTKAMLTRQQIRKNHYGQLDLSYLSFKRDIRHWLCQCSVSHWTKSWTHSKSYIPNNPDKFYVHSVVLWTAGQVNCLLFFKMAQGIGMESLTTRDTQQTSIKNVLDDAVSKRFDLFMVVELSRWKSSGVPHRSILHVHTFLSAWNTFKNNVKCFTNYSRQHQLDENNREYRWQFFTWILYFCVHNALHCSLQESNGEAES